MTTVLQDRMAQIETISLTKGDHEANDELQMCVMEMVAYVAGEPWSAHPQCACQVITSFLISWNDSLPSDAERDRLLKPLIPLIVGTRSTKDVEQRRSYLALDWLIRVHAPKWLGIVPVLQDHAKALRELDAISDKDSSVAAGTIINAARDAARDAAGDAVGDAARAAARPAVWAAAWPADGAAAGDAAWAAAWAAAWPAVGAAAGDASRAAAWAAAGAAAGDAAWAGAWAAAGAAAGYAAGDAAWAAAWDALKPTTQWLQLSAVQLVRDMIAIQPNEVTA